MRDDAVLRRALPLGRGLGRICEVKNELNLNETALELEIIFELKLKFEVKMELSAEQ